MSTSLIITATVAGTVALLALAGIAAWRSVACKRIAAGGTSAWSLWTWRQVVPEPAAAPAAPPAPPADDQSGVLGFARNEDAA